MWNFLNGNHFDSFKHQNAITLKARDVVLDALTWNEVLEISKRISIFLSESIFTTKENCCIGLLMSHNIYVPSLVLSMQKLRLSFMFLSGDSFEDDVKELGIEWVVSLDVSRTKYKVCKRIQLRGSDEIVMFHTGRNGSSYEGISYIIRTSGTTGESKYVQVQEYCIRNNVESLSVSFQATPNDVIFFGTPLTFDPSMIELFLALNTGAALLIVPPRTKINPTSLYETLFPPVTVLQIVPSLFSRWSPEQIRNVLLNSTLRILAFGGEEFPNHILLNNNELSKRLRIFNLYGITEVSCWAALHEVGDVSCEVPVGDPIGDTIIQVRSDDGEVVEEGEGEIFIGSHSRVCLVKNEPNPPPPVFRPTGDLAKINDQSIYYLTRKNGVVKRFGHKINLIRTETTILKLTGLPNKCVWLKQESKLLCFLRVNNLANASKVLDRIRVKLLHGLAEHSYPDFIELLVKFPITSHGKINRNALENVYLNRQRSERGDEAFEMLASKYLGLDEKQFGDLAGCNFFELGGNSVLAVQLLAELSDVFDHPPELAEVLFEKDMKSCIDCLKKCSPKRKNVDTAVRSKENNDAVAFKRARSDFQLEIAWSYDLKACVDASPLVFESSDGKVLVAAGSFSGIFAVLDAKNGEEITKFMLPEAIEGAALVSSDSTRLYVGCFDGKLYCLDWANGKIAWSYSTGDRIKCTPSFCRDSTGIVFGSYDKHLHCVEANDGKSVWKKDVSESIVSRPVVWNGQIFVATIFGTCLCLSEETGSISWTFKTTSPIFGSPCLLDDCIVWPNVQGILICMSLQGLELWKLPVGGLLYSSVLHHAGYAIFGNNDGNLYFVNLSTREIFKIALGSPISSSPSLWRNIRKESSEECVVTATNSGSVFVIELDNKLVVSELQLSAEVFSSPAIFQDSIYVGCRDNRLCCIKRL